MSHHAIKLILAGLVVAATAQNNIDTCSNGELYIHNGDSWCCPGAVYGDSNGNTDNAYCCVGARFDVAGPSFAPCFPFCSGDGVTVTSTTQESCSATVMLTDSAYSSKVSAAAAGLSVPETTATGESSRSGGSSTGSEASSTTSSGGGSDEAAQTGSSSTSEAGAAAMITSGPMMGAMMVAGGYLLAV